MKKMFFLFLVGVGGVKGRKVLIAAIIAKAR